MNTTPSLFSRKSEKPAILGGEPLGRTPLPFVRPQLPPLEDLEGPYREILSNGMVTTGLYAERLGEALRAHLGVRHAVAVSSCTTGLMLAVQALNLPRGSVAVLPSFTFMATALGAVWNGLRLRFVDVDRETMNIDPARVEEALTADTSVIIGVHQFGAPAPVEDLRRVADTKGISLLFDAAHGFGSLCQGQPLGGHGRAEVFSLSPTKLLIAAEGGVVATGEEDIATHVRLGRNYGNPGNYDCRFPGLNARMSELHAILALKSLERLEEAAANRNRAAHLYRELLRNVPGVSFQKVLGNDRSSFKDFSIVVDERAFGLTRDQLARALAAEGIHTRVYYAPVLHKMEAFRPYAGENPAAELPHTLYLESHALSLPMYSDMKEEEIERVAASLVRIQRHALPIASLNLSA